MKILYKLAFILAIILISFISGRLTSIQKTVTEKISTVDTKKEIVTQQTVQTQSSEAKTQYIEKKFNKKGVLVSEKIKTTSGGVNFGIHTAGLIATTSENRFKSTIQNNEVSNYLIGVYYPAEDIKKFQPSDLSFSISCRLIGGFYLTALSDASFSKLQVGATLAL